MISAVLQSKPDRRYSLCDFCGVGFTMTAAEFYSSEDHVCPDCDHKRLTLLLLREELKSAAKYGHASPGEPCPLCSVQNRIEDILRGGYGWREEYERLTDTSIR